MLGIVSGNGELERFEDRLEKHLKEKSADGVVVHLCSPKEVAGASSMQHLCTHASTSTLIITLYRALK